MRRYQLILKSIWTDRNEELAVEIPEDCTFERLHGILEEALGLQSGFGYFFQVGESFVALDEPGTLNVRMEKVTDHVGEGMFYRSESGEMNDFDVIWDGEVTASGNGFRWVTRPESAIQDIGPLGIPCEGDVEALWMVARRGSMYRHRYIDDEETDSEMAPCADAVLRDYLRRRSCRGRSEKHLFARVRVCVHVRAFIYNIYIKEAD